jgi:hypothetical protein
MIHIHNNNAITMKDFSRVYLPLWSTAAGDDLSGLGRRRAFILGEDKEKLGDTYVKENHRIRKGDVWSTGSSRPTPTSCWGTFTSFPNWRSVKKSQATSRLLGFGKNIWKVGRVVTLLPFTVIF